MNIIEALQNYDKNMKVKIGCEDGDSYWFVGRVKNVLEDAQTISQTMKQNCYSQMRRAERALTEHLHCYPTPRAYCKSELEKEDPLPTVKGYEEALQEYFIWAVKKQETVKKRRALYNNFKGLLDREVIFCEECDPVADENCVRVIIEGREKGIVWTTDEVKRFPSYAFSTYC